MGKKIYNPMNLDEHVDVEFSLNLLIEEINSITDLLHQNYPKSHEHFKYLQKSLIYLNCTKRVLREQSKIDKNNLKDKRDEWEMLYMLSV